MTQAWTIIDGATGELLYACYQTADGQHPVEDGYVATATTEFIPLDFIPAPGRFMWDGAQWVPNPEVLQAHLWARVKELRDAAEAEATTSFGRVQSDLKSKVNITGLVAMAQLAIAAGGEFAEPFTMADNSVRVFSAPELISMAQQVGAHVAAAYAQARDLRARIFADGITAAELEGIDVEAGWP